MGFFFQEKSGVTFGVLCNFCGFQGGIFRLWQKDPSLYLFTSDRAQMREESGQ